MTADVELPPKAREVLAKLERVPWVWALLLTDLEAEEKREPKANRFRLRLDLIGAFGRVVDAVVDLNREQRKPAGPTSRIRP